MTNQTEMDAKKDTKRAPLLVFGLLAAFLTGADGNGCDIDQTPEPPPQPSTSGGGEGFCPLDHHIEVICDDAPMGNPPPQQGGGGGMPGPWNEMTTVGGGPPPPTPGGSCVEVCVPDGMCPPGHDEVWICDDEPCPGEGASPNFPHEVCLDPNGCFEEPGQCYPTCVPSDPCGPGAHEEYVCEWAEPPMTEPPFPCLDPNGCAPPEPTEPPMEVCTSICVDDELCGPGMHEEWECPGDGMGQGMNDCFSTCVPDGPCPPGLEPNIQCEGELCWSTCEPEPSCPPGTFPDLICAGQECYVECVPEGSLP